MVSVNIIGAGLAGCEASYQLAKKGIKVKLYEMRPVKTTDAHTTDLFAELVCSNSLRSNALENAVGLLKEEMRLLDSLIIEASLINRVEAGSSLAVDRLKFSSYITSFINNHPLIEVIKEEVKKIPTGPTIICTGPLTSDTFSKAIQEFTGFEYLYFYDSVAPIVTKESIDFSKVYYKSRYDKNEAAYINCPMNEEEFNIFYDALINSEKVIPLEYELKVFEGCMAVEDMAERGKNTLLFGPLKPVGLKDPRTDKTPFAVVQLREENISKSLYNLVGFQTHLKWSEQKRVFGLIPGLENVEFVRYGVMHKNIFINSPKLLNKYYQTLEREDLFFAGQITGVEGYIESASSGLVAGINMAKLIKNEELIDFTNHTAIGSLSNYIASPNHNFQPMNVNHGIFEPITGRYKKLDRKMIYAKRSLEKLEGIINGRLS